MRARHVAVSIALCLSCTQRLGAQSSALPPEPGSRVSVVIPSNSGRQVRIAVGSLVRLSGDTVVIASGQRQPDTLVLGPSRRLEVRTAVGRGHGRQGALWGFLVGGLGGAIVGAATYQPCTEGLCIMDPGEGGSAAAGFLLGGLFGAGVGAAIGSSIRTEVWTPVATPGVRVGLVVMPRGAGLTVQF